MKNLLRMSLFIIARAGLCLAVVAWIVGQWWGVQCHMSSSKTSFQLVAMRNANLIRMSIQPVANPHFGISFDESRSFSIASDVRYGINSGPLDGLSSRLPGGLVKTYENGIQSILTTAIHH